MRAREFIRSLNEADMHHYHHQAIPGAKAYPGMGQSYDMYRFSVAMAGAPNNENHMSNGTDATDNPATVSYSHGDQAIIDGALKMLGKEGIEISGKGSSEPEDTNKVSPMLPFAGVKRKNKNSSDRGIY